MVIETSVITRKRVNMAQTQWAMGYLSAIFVSKRVFITWQYHPNCCWDIQWVRTTASFVFLFFFVFVVCFFSSIRFYLNFFCFIFVVSKRVFITWQYHPNCCWDIQWVRTTASFVFLFFFVFVVCFFSSIRFYLNFFCFIFVVCLFLFVSFFVLCFNEISSLFYFLFCFVFFVGWFLLVLFLLLFCCCCCCFVFLLTVWPAVAKQN